MKKLILLILLFSINLAITKADGFDDVLTHLRSGNASAMVKLFNTNVELTLMDNEGVYSRQQAEVMLKNFFAQHPPKSVNMQHKGSSSKGAMYAIAVYEAANGKYRAYIFMKDSGSGMQVNEFRIERD